MTDRYLVPAENMPTLRHRVGKLARRARKLGLTPPGIKTYGEQVVKTDGQPDRLMLNVRVVGVAPKIAGWTFVARINHDLEIPTVYAVPGEVYPHEFRFRSADCDHCNVARRRNDTFIVRHDSGEYKLVGRTCLADFLGHEDPHNIVRWMQYLTNIEACANDCTEDMGHRPVVVVGTLGYLAATAAIIRTLGWVSRTRANNDYMAGKASADWSWDMMFPSSWDKQQREFFGEINITDCDNKMAMDAYMWADTVVRAYDDKSDYHHNLLAALDTGKVTFKLAGIVASLIAVYGKAMDRKREEERAVDSVHVGEIGKRDIFDVTLVSRSYHDSQFGTSALHIFEDVTGNIIKWFSSNKDVGNIGDKLQIKGTVKKHDEYRGIKQTLINRVVEVN